MSSARPSGSPCCRAAFGSAGGPRPFPSTKWATAAACEQLEAGLRRALPTVALAGASYHGVGDTGLHRLGPPGGASRARAGGRSPATAASPPGRTGSPVGRTARAPLRRLAPRAAGHRGLSAFAERFGHSGHIDDAREGLTPEQARRWLRVRRGCDRRAGRRRPCRCCARPRDNGRSRGARIPSSRRRRRRGDAGSIQQGGGPVPHADGVEGHGALGGLGRGDPGLVRDAAHPTPSRTNSDHRPSIRWRACSPETAPDSTG